MNEPKKTPLALVVLAWLVVALPLAWGLYQSVMKSMPLLHHG
jgi:hypothetical protein